MTIRIFGNHFENCETGISAPKDANLEIGGNQFVACGKAIDLRDPPTLMQAMGLRNDTPTPLVRELFEFAAAAQREEVELQSKAESIGLLDWLAAGANASTLIAALVSLGQYTPKILAMLGT